MAASSSSGSGNASNSEGTRSVEATINEYKLAIGSFVSERTTGISAEQVASLLQGSTSKDDCDWTLPVPGLNKFGKQQGSPAALATKCASEFQPTSLLKEAKASGVFLHFNVEPALLRERVLRGVFADKEHYGCSTVGAGKTVVVEYSSPNMAKPFHAGHLRSTIIGNFLKNVYVALGYNTVAMNYLGDWGTQYGMMAVGFDKYGDEQKLQESPLQHLYEVYVAINKESKEQEEAEEKLPAGESIKDRARHHFKLMEAGDPAALQIWQRFRDISIEKSKGIYARMNVTFDVYSGESCYPLSKQQEVIELLEAKGLLVTEESGARVIDLTKYKLGKVVFQKSDGSLLYIARDIAAALDRSRTYGFNKMIYVVASQQQLHFQQLFKVLELLEFAPVKDCVHVNFGMVKGMSTRKGTAVFLEDILDAAREENLEVMQKNEEKFKEVENPEYTADVVGISAVVIQDLTAKRIKDYTFDWKRMLQTIGDTGAYLQFAHVRIASIMRKANIPVEVEGVDLTLLSEPECHTLISWLADYPSTLLRAEAQLEPSLVVQFTLKLTHMISAMLEKMHVKHAATPELGKARMLMFWAAKQCVENALRLLSLVPLERM